MAKVTLEESTQIKTRYQEIADSTDLKRGEIIRMLMKEFERPKTTIHDHVYSKREVKEVKKKEVVEFVHKEMPVIQTQQKFGKKTYIIASWEIRVGVHDGFLDCLNVLADELNAEKLLIPLWHKDLDYIPTRLRDEFEIVTDNVEFNNNQKLYYVPTSALASSVISGWVGKFEDTTIIPGLLKELRTLPSHKYYKQIMSTGSVGYLDANFDQYRSLLTEDIEINGQFSKRWGSVVNRAAGKTNAIAREKIKPSALIVTVLDDETFLTRFVTMETPNVIYDLDKKITPSGVHANRPKALCLGDSHIWTKDPFIYESNKEMMEFFNPERTYLNDFFDGASCSHFDFANAASFSKAPSIEEEAMVTREALLDYAQYGDLVWLESNHCRRIIDFLTTPKVHRYNNNYAIACELEAFRMRDGRHPIIQLLGLDDIPNVRFSSVKETCFEGKVAVLHGWESYGRMGFKGFVNTYDYVNTGHFHSPTVDSNAVSLGSSSTKDPDYGMGASPIMGANALIHEDSSQQLLPVLFDGRWRK